MDEKIQYRLDERTTDLQDNVENCQTRVSEDNKILRSCAIKKKIMI